MAPRWAGVLFYDRRLSANNTTSCASCHVQAHAFADPKPFSRGFHGARTDRRAMPLVNVRYYERARFFWDERAGNLEEMVLLPIQSRIEMGQDLNGLAGTLARDAMYRAGAAGELRRGGRPQPGLRASPARHRCPRPRVGPSRRCPTVGQPESGPALQRVSCPNEAAAGTAIGVIGWLVPGQITGNAPSACATPPGRPAAPDRHDRRTQSPAARPSPLPRSV
jgi:hypothetical protein